ncbi:PBECR2 nuclease fold domain-containing protein [Stutzerimonas nitrititolerans]|uniref:PBECR2 nuclease fold domain-containing protein n=1 Tax=Stutzerimonas nitrititolerans TaxID=2482751 RepID=UPI0028979189|nr:PBECR2 nuclease fold domain-containing protein [Stutzerimonas nitrititolerans]
MAVSATSLPFQEQNEFLRRKLNLPTNGWTDVYGREHDYAFTVAGANRDELVADFHQAVQRAIEGGTTLEDFRKDFDRIVARHGWSYNGGRNWRSRVIYETNMRSSYMAGRYEQLMAVREERPYWQYLHSDAVEYPRPEHEAWNGMILRWDDPWWQHHFPINAWGCQCSVRALSEDDLVRLGKAGPDTAPPIVFEQRTIGQRSPQGPRTVQVPQGVDPGFEHIPGQSRLESAVPRPRLDDELIPAPAPGLPNRIATDPLPPARPFPTERILPADLPDITYVQRYLEEFGATLQTPAVIRDVIGERLVVGKELFTDRVTGQLKANKRGRGQWLLMLAEALKQPDEIWTRLEWLGALGKAVVRRRYLARFEVSGQAAPAVAVFEVGADGWIGVTTFPPADDGYVDGLRQGVRLFQAERR